MGDGVHIYDFMTDKDITGGELILSSDTDHKTKPILARDLKTYTNKELIQQMKDLSERVEYFGDSIKALESMFEVIESKYNEVNKFIHLPWYKKLFYKED